MLELTKMQTQINPGILIISRTKTGQFYVKLPFQTSRAIELAEINVRHIRNDLGHCRRAVIECLVTVPVESLIIGVLVHKETWLFVDVFNPNHS